MTINGRHQDGVTLLAIGAPPTISRLKMTRDGVSAWVAPGSVLRSSKLQGAAVAKITAITGPDWAITVHGAEPDGTRWCWDSRGLNHNALKGWDVDIVALTTPWRTT